jgi:hypothetical protein
VAHAALLLDELLLGLLDLGPEPIVEDEVVTDLVVAITL